eukprot:5637662-Heterocapsa_arctica.AAC.1
MDTSLSTSCVPGRRQDHRPYPVVPRLSVGADTLESSRHVVGEGSRESGQRRFSARRGVRGLDKG